MKVLVVFFSLLWTSYAVADVSRLHINIERWQTTNGLSVWFVQRKQLPIVDMSMIIDAGSARDTQSGVANLTAHALSLGTQQENERQLAQRLAKIGAQFSVDVTRDYALLHLRSLANSPYRQQAANCFAEMLTEPTFPPQALQSLKQKWLTVMQYQAKQPAAVAQMLFWQHLYAGTVYAHPVIGTPKTVPQITPSVIQTFYNQYYVARNAHLVLVGDISRQQAHKLANLIAAKLPMGEAAKPYHVVPNRTEKNVYRYLPTSQTTLLMGQPALPSDSPQRFALQVDNEILGGGQLFSLLYQRIRAEQGLVYSINSALLLRYADGPWLLQAQTRNPQAQSALLLIRGVIANFVKHGPTKSELALAKQALIGHFPLALASNAGLTQALLQMAFYHLPMTYLDTYQQRIRSVTLTQAKEALSVLHLHEMLAVQVGG